MDKVQKHYSSKLPVRILRRMGNNLTLDICKWRRLQFYGDNDLCVGGNSAGDEVIKEDSTSSRNDGNQGNEANNGNHVRFQVLTAASMKYRVFSDILPCSQIYVAI
jgi:hypothetical protein